MKLLLRFVLALSILAALAAHATAQTPQNPFPITGQTIITQSGYYQLRNNINFTGASGTIIQVNASNVTIDFNGFFIAGPVGNTTQTVQGIVAFERSNLTIFNGTVAFCYRGISISGNGGASTNNVGHRVTGMRITYCYLEGVNVDQAPGTNIIGNQISQIGGYRGQTNTDANGLNLTGSGILVESNNIVNVTGVGTGVARGIYAGVGVFVQRNVIANSARGIQFGKCYNNLTDNCATPFTGITDAGANN